MDHPLRRLLVIAFLVSITFSSSAQNETLSVEDEDRILCLPGTTDCNNPHPGNNNPMLNEETIADSPVEASDEENYHENDCIPGTTHCKNPQPGNRKLNEEATADSPVEASDEENYHENDCIPGTTHCKNPQPGNRKLNEDQATADSPVEASGEEDASKSDASIICDPITKLCEGAPSTRIVCNPITHKCTQPKTNSIVSESDKDEQTKDDSAIHEEEEKISPLVCDPKTGNCQEPHQAFGVAQPRDQVA